MKTAFPDHDRNRNRNRYLMMAADEYEEYYARHIAPAEEPQPDPDAYLRSEEAAVERMIISVGVAVIEAFMGRRPMHHLSPWLSVACYRTVERQVEKTHRLIQQTFTSSPAIQQRKKPTVTPRRMILQKVSAKAYESCLIIQDSQKARALALRAEYINRRWKVTTIEIA